MAAWKRPCKVEDCSNIVGPKGARGLCNKHYLRWLNTGDPLGSLRPEPIARFWPKVNKTEHCWIWTGSKDQDGYGMFSDKVNHRAHRWLFVYLNGPIEDGMVLDHLCRNTSCVNPGHLEVVTNDENLERGWGRRIKTGLSNECINGHEYTPNNTYINPLGRKVCRACSAVSRARYKRKQAA